MAERLQKWIISCFQVQEISVVQQGKVSQTNLASIAKKVDQNPNIGNIKLDESQIMNTSAPIKISDYINNPLIKQDKKSKNYSRKESISSVTPKYSQVGETIIATVFLEIVCDNIEFRMRQISRKDLVQSQASLSNQFQT